MKNKKSYLKIEIPLTNNEMKHQINLTSKYITTKNKKMSYFMNKKNLNSKKEGEKEQIKNKRKNKSEKYHLRHTSNFSINLINPKFIENEKRQIYSQKNINLIFKKDLKNKKKKFLMNSKKISQTKKKYKKSNDFLNLKFNKKRPSLKKNIKNTSNFYSTKNCVKFKKLISKSPKPIKNSLKFKKSILTTTHLNSKKIELFVSNNNKRFSGMRQNEKKSLCVDIYKKKFLSNKKIRNFSSGVKNQKKDNLKLKIEKIAQLKKIFVNHLKSVSVPKNTKKHFKEKNLKQNNIKEKNLKKNLNKNFGEKDSQKNLEKKNFEEKNNPDKTSGKMIKSKSLKSMNNFIIKIEELGKKIEKLYNIINAQKDPYNIIREYVDFIQENNFNILSKILIDENFQKKFRIAFILERWVIFIIFYLFLEKKNRLISEIIKTIIFTTLTNFLLYITFLEKTQKTLFKKNLQNLKKNFEIPQISKKDLNYNLEKNIKKILTFLDDAKPLTEKKIQLGLQKLNSQLKTLTIDQSLTTLLDSFFDYFQKKGIVTVEYINNSKINKNKKIHTNPKNGPFLKMPSSKEYSLILDLDETLVHYKHEKKGGQLLLRPFLDFFLEKMSFYYEIIIFTAGVQNYADQIINLIDKKKIIEHRLYRRHTVFEGNSFFKDLSLIGRDLKKVVIVDNLEKNFRKQEENGVFVRSWYEDREDSVLRDLVPFLRDIVVRESEDVRRDLKVVKKLFRNGQLGKC